MTTFQHTTKKEKKKKLYWLCNFKHGEVLVFISDLYMQWYLVALDQRSRSQGHLVQKYAFSLYILLLAIEWPNFYEIYEIWLLVIEQA